MRIFVHDYAGHPFAVELSRALARRGHMVRHAYFAGDIGPKGSLERRGDDPEGFSILPIALDRPYSKTNLVQRHRMDGLYGRRAARALEAFAPDVALIANTPPNAVASLQAAAARADVRLVLWLQDVFGMAAAALLRRKWGGVGAIAAAYYQRLEARVLRRAEHIVAITDDFPPYLERLGVSPSRISVIENWGPLSEIAPRDKANPWSEEHGLTDKLVFAYTGTLALKHNPERLRQLAEAFSDRPDVQVRVAATGVGADWLAREQATQPTPRLVLTGLEPIERLAHAYGGSDMLVGLLEPAAGAFSAPSKVLAYLCAGRPILLSAPLDNLASRTVLAAGAGLVAPPDDQDAFLAAARRLADSPELRAQLGAAGRAYAERTFAIEAVADRFEPVLGARA